MSSSHRLWAVRALFAVPLFLCASAALAGDADHFTVVERAQSDFFVDIGAEGESTGDLLTFYNEIYDAKNETLVGSDTGFCVRIEVGASWECQWTLSLDDGQIMVQGPFLDAGDSALSVTGGTGAYAGVGGEMLLHARNAEGSEYDFTYNLTR